MKFEGENSTNNENSIQNSAKIENHAQNFDKKTQKKNKNASNAEFQGENSAKSIDNIALFDPQTSGGLLCALPSKKAEFALEKLQKTGINAAIIGICKALKNEKPFIRVI